MGSVGIFVTPLTKISCQSIGLITNRSSGFWLQFPGDVSLFTTQY